jgi:SAM-dependent methyltransferase
VRNRISKLPVFRWHEDSVHIPRVQRLSTAIAELAPSANSMLDIGCGDGTMARGIAEKVGASGDMHGVDVLVRPNAVIDVKQYDGYTLPFENDRFDLITICDVLHHADDPKAVVHEAMRVLSPRGSLVIKDHFRFGQWSNAVLLAMDIFGNYAAGVLVRGHYLTPPQWIELVTSAGGAIDRVLWPFEVHDLPWRLVAKSEYQFLMRVRRPG